MKKSAGLRFCSADEPTGNLDAETSHNIIEMLFELNKAARTTLLLVTHDAEIAQRAKRIIRLKGEASSVTQRANGSQPGQTNNPSRPSPALRNKGPSRNKLCRYRSMSSRQSHFAAHFVRAWTWRMAWRESRTSRMPGCCSLLPRSFSELRRWSRLDLLGTACRMPWRSRPRHSWAPTGSELARGFLARGRSIFRFARGPAIAGDFLFVDDLFYPNARHSACAGPRVEWRFSILRENRDRADQSSPGIPKGRRRPG